MSEGTKGAEAPATTESATPPAAAPAQAPTTATSAAPAAPPAAAPAKDAASLLAGEAKPPTAKLEVKFPEGFAASAEAVQKLEAVAGELGLDSPKAQKLADAYVSVQRAVDEAAEASFVKQRQAWREAVKADKDIGGESFDANLKTAQKAVAKFGGEALARALNETGLGDHPELVRAFVRIGKAMAEDSSAGAVNGASAARASEADYLRKMYPSMFKE